MLDCWDRTATFATLAVCLDEDDPCKRDYVTMLDAYPSDKVITIGGRWRSLCDWTNFVAVKAVDRFNIIGQTDDDRFPRTPGWDLAVADAMKPLGVVYCNDLHQGDAVAGGAFFDAEIIRRLGYMVPPTIQHLYMDNYMKALGEALGTLTYLPDVIIEHMHPDAGKADMDDGYRQVNSRDGYRDGKRAFQSYINHRLEQDLVKLI